MTIEPATQHAQLSIAAARDGNVASISVITPSRRVSTALSSESTIMIDDADKLIYASASSMHSIAATLTGEAKQELSTLREFLEVTKALRQDKAMSLAAGVAEVRQHLVMGPTPDPIGDGNRLWDVFTAAWTARQQSIGQESLLLKMLDSLSYVLECHAESCHGEVKSELIRLRLLLDEKGGHAVSGWDQIRDEVSRIDNQYQSTEGRRAAVHAICRLTRSLWVLAIRSPERGGVPSDRGPARNPSSTPTSRDGREPSQQD